MNQSRSFQGGQIKIALDTDKIEAIRMGVLARYKVQVGILGDKNARLARIEDESHANYKKRAKKWDYKGDTDTLTNAEIGLKNEKGSYSERIPPRSFLEVPLTKHMPEKLKAIAKALDAAISKVDVNLKVVYTEVGILAQQVIQRAFETSGDNDWDKNADLTIELKGSAKPLIDTGQLRRSIMSRVVTS